MFELDRTAFKIKTFQEADSNVRYWLSRTPRERLEAAHYLIRRAWNIADDDVIRMDKTVSRVKLSGMADMFSKDLQEFIEALNKAEVEYILVGGYAVVLHGYSRTTGDVDIWVNPTSENYRRVADAFQVFGMPLFDMTEPKFLNTRDYDVFSFGVPPNAIDLMTKVKGLDFDQAFQDSSIYEFEDLSLRLISYQNLIEAKQASGRTRDLADIEQLKKREV